LKKYNSKDFRKENYFVLYDMNDNVVCYFDNCEELIAKVGSSVHEIVRKFNNSDDCIILVINLEKYKLYTFVEKLDEKSNFFLVLWR